MASDSEQSKVAAFFAKRSVFLTGGSGLVGKVILEKLLWAVPDIGNVYVLMRPKRGLSESARLERMKDLPMFFRVRRDCPDQFNKIKVLPGDVGLEELGLSDDDRSRVLKDVSVVLHCAATLRLEGSLHSAIQLNTKGTQRLLNLAKRMPNLVVFIHTSTAFCHVGQDILGEQTYPPPHDPLDMIHCSDVLDEQTLEKISPRILGKYPNSYLYSKCLAEEIVTRSFPELPVAIVRPSVVTPSWNEPLEGWVDGLNGPVGVIAGAAKGVIRSMHCKADYRAEIIPLDYVANSTIVAAWRVATSPSPPAIPVYNLTCGSQRAQTWGELLEKGRTVGYANPFEMMLWYPDGNMRESKAEHKFYAFFLHFLPAYFIDFLMILFLQPRFMVRIYHRIALGLDLLEFFTTRSWKFDNDGFLSLWNELSPADKRLFNFDLDAVDSDEYMVRLVLGARQYCLKEPLSSLPRQRRLLKVYYVVDRLVQCCFYLGLIWILMRCIGVLN